MSGRGAGGLTAVELAGPAEPELVAESADWLRRLSVGDGSLRQQAERELHARLVRIALAEVSRRSASAPRHRPRAHRCRAPGRRKPPVTLDAGQWERLPGRLGIDPEQHAVSAGHPHGGAPGRRGRADRAPTADLRGSRDRRHTARRAGIEAEHLSHPLPLPDGLSRVVRDSDQKRQRLPGAVTGPARYLGVEPGRAGALALFNCKPTSAEGARCALWPQARSREAGCRCREWMGLGLIR